MHTQLTVVIVVEQNERRFGDLIGADAKHGIDRALGMLGENGVNGVDYAAAFVGDDRCPKTRTLGEKPRQLVAKGLGEADSPHALCGGTPSGAKAASVWAMTSARE